ncbi:MAG: ZIP family metal transporter, partial [Crocinitomicaceae bacterium]|nr:ZIP family metal transporter [Crocinitomicaceae bacterium]
MKDLELFFKSIDPVLAALIATTFTWLVTAAGASLVFFFKTMHRGVLDGMLGFTGGVMVAASFWSLLMPSIEMSEKYFPNMAWMPAAVGFLLGALFLFFLDKWMPHLHINFSENESEGVKTQLHRTTL